MEPIIIYNKGSYSKIWLASPKLEPKYFGFFYFFSTLEKRILSGSVYDAISWHFLPQTHSELISCADALIAGASASRRRRAGWWCTFYWTAVAKMVQFNSPVDNLTTGNTKVRWWCASQLFLIILQNRVEHSPKMRRQPQQQSQTQLQIEQTDDECTSSPVRRQLSYFQLVLQVFLVNHSFLLCTPTLLVALLCLS